MIFNDNGSMVASEMTYDVNANLTRDMDKGISSMIYSIIIILAIRSEVLVDLVILGHILKNGGHHLQKAGNTYSK